MKTKLIDNWRQSWKFLSVQIGIAAGALSTAIIWAVPGLLISVLRAPLEERIFVGVMFGAAITFLPWLARVWKQKKLEDDCDANR